MDGPRPWSWGLVAQGLCVEDENELLDAVVRCRRLRFQHAIPPEGALLQDPDRASVVHRDMGIQRASRHMAYKLRERLRRDAAAPVLATDPVAEHALPVLLPAPDVARHGAIHHDRELDYGVVGAGLRPVRGELLLVASGE